MNTGLTEEQELQQFISQSRYPQTKEVLLQRLSALRSETTPMEVEQMRPIQVEEKPQTAKESQESSTTPKVPSPPSTRLTYVPIDSFSWEQGEYNSPTVTVYVDIPGVGAVKE